MSDSLQVTVKMSAGLKSSEGLTGAEESTSKLPHIADGRSPQFFAMWTSSYSTSSMAAGFSWSEWRERDR